MPDAPRDLEEVIVERPRLVDYTGAAPTIFVTPGLSEEFGRPNIPDEAPADDGGSSRTRDTGTRTRDNPREQKRGSKRGGRNPEVKRAPPPRTEDLLGKKLPQPLPQPPPNLRPPSPIDLTLPYTEEIVSTSTRLGQLGRGLLGLAGAGLNFLGLFLTPSPLGDSDLGLSTRAPGASPDTGTTTPPGDVPEVIVEAPRLPAPEPPPLPFDFLPFNPGATPGGGRYPLPDAAPDDTPAPAPVPVPGTPTMPGTPDLPMPGTPTVPFPTTPTLPLPLTPPAPVPVPVPVPIPIDLPLPATPTLPNLPLPVQLPTPTPQLPTPTPQLPPQFLTSPLAPTPIPMPGGLTPPKPPGVSLPPKLAFGDVPPSAGGRGGCKPCKPCKKSKKKKKKKKERKERTICYRGTYTETTKSTLKQRKEQIPCQSSSKSRASPPTRPSTTSSAVPRLNSRAAPSSSRSASRSRRPAFSLPLPAAPTSLLRNRRRR